MQPGRPELEQLGAQRAGDVDADAAHLDEVVDAVEPIDQPAGMAAPLSSAIRRTWPPLVIGMMPGQHRLVDAEGGELVDEADVVLGLEEELGDGEVGPRQLGGQQPAVGRPVG